MHSMEVMLMFLTYNKCFGCVATITTIIKMGIIGLILPYDKYLFIDKSCFFPPQFVRPMFPYSLPLLALHPHV